MFEAGSSGGGGVEGRGSFAGIWQLFVNIQQLHLDNDKGQIFPLYFAITNNLH